MSAQLKNTAALFLGIAILFFSSGMLFVLVVVRAREAGFSTEAIGLLQSSYQIGWLIAAVFISKFIHRVGHIRVFAAMTAIGSAIILLQILHIDELAWILERLIMGTTTAGLMVVAESWLNGMSDNSERGRNLAIYTIVSWGAPIGGVWILRFGTPSDDEFFIIASVLISVAAIPLLLSTAKSPKIIKLKVISLKKLFRITPLGVSGTLLAGLSHGAFFTMVPLYGTVTGLDIVQVSTLTSLALLSGILLQWPISLLSDKYDRRVILMATAGLAALPAGYFALQEVTDVTQQYIAVALMGAFSLSLYSQCISHANDHLKSSQIVPAAGLLVLLYGAGTATVPIILGQLMAITANYFYIVNGFLAATLALYTFYRILRSDSLQNQGEMVNVPTGSPYSTVVRAAEEWADVTDDRSN